MAIRSRMGQRLAHPASPATAARRDLGSITDVNQFFGEILNLLELASERFQGQVLKVYDGSSCSSETISKPAAVEEAPTPSSSSSDRPNRAGIRNSGTPAAFGGRVSTPPGGSPLCGGGPQTPSDPATGKPLQHLGPHPAAFEGGSPFEGGITGAGLSVAAVQNGFGAAPNLRQCKPPSTVRNPCWALWYRAYTTDRLCRTIFRSASRPLAKTVGDGSVIAIPQKPSTCKRTESPRCCPALAQHIVRQDVL